MDRWFYWAMVATALVFVAACSVWLLLLAIEIAGAASNEHLRGRDCKAEANWALILNRDVKAGMMVNVMPQDQPTLDLVTRHRGTDIELWWKVYYACTGEET